MKKYIKSSSTDAGWYTGEPSNFAKNGHSYYSDPQDWKDKQERIERAVSKYNIPGLQLSKSRWKMIYQTKDTSEPYKFDLWEDEYDLDIQIAAFEMWALDEGLIEI